MEYCLILRCCIRLQHGFTRLLQYPTMVSQNLSSIRNTLKVDPLPCDYCLWSVCPSAHVQTHQNTEKCWYNWYLGQADKQISFNKSELPVSVSSSKVSGWGDETNRKLQHIMRNQTIEKSIISIHADYTSSVKGNGSTKRIEAMVYYRDCPGFKNMFSYQFINDGISRRFRLCWVSAGLVERELTSADPPNTSTSQSVR